MCIFSNSEPFYNYGGSKLWSSAERVCSRNKHVTTTNEKSFRSIILITTGVRVHASVPELGSELHSLNCGCRRNKRATEIARDGAGHGGSIKYYIVSRKCTDDITRFGTKHSHSSSKMKARPTSRRHLCSQRTILRRPMIEKTKSRGYYHDLLFWNAVNINKLEEHRRKHYIGAGSKDRRPF